MHHHAVLMAPHVTLVRYYWLLFIKRILPITFMIYNRMFTVMLTDQEIIQVEETVIQTVNVQGV